MKFLSKILRRKASEAAPEQELFPASDMQANEAEEELAAAFQTLYLTSLSRRRKAVLDAFNEAAHYSPLPGPARDNLSAAFSQAVEEVSSGQQLLLEGFNTVTEMTNFLYEAGNKLRAIAQDSKIQELRLQALAAIPAVTLANTARISSDVYFLIAFTRDEEDPAVRAGALKSLGAIATSKAISSLTRATAGSFGAAYDIRYSDTFRPIDYSSYAEYQECIMGVAAHVLRTDASLPRMAAAQVLRDIAASDPPKYQFLAASFAHQARSVQYDLAVIAVIQGILDDAKVVNFPRHQRVPGVTV